MLAEIENAIIHAIQSAPGMRYLKAVDSYGGEFDSETFDVIRALPAVWVVFAGSGKPQKIGAQKFLTPATFAVMCGARSVRSEKATRQNGPGGEVGVYRILEDVSSLLLMKDLGLAIDHFQPGSVKTLYNTQLRSNGLAVFAQEWHTKFTQTVPAESSTPLKSVGLAYTEAATGKTEASDVVQLPINI
ncbi:phage protein Gp37 [Undibacterium sp. SXout11W]|uniref:phage protein Gp37 n=1 Tax=Undibacterium sp. SXout11W TaxID=3413050 RepID=UPI003BF140DA